MPRTDRWLPGWSAARVGSKRWCVERGEGAGALCGRSGVGGSGCDAVFVDEPSAVGSASDRVVEFDHGRVGVVGGCLLAETAMWSVLVVVRHELFEEPT